MSEWFNIQEEEKKVEEVKPYRIGMIGSQVYEDKRKIKELIFEFVKKFKHLDKEYEIVSGGRKYGADKHIKKYAMEFGCSYREFNPAHTVRNLYSAMPRHYYGKKYQVFHFFQRNSMMLKYVDYLVIFKKQDDSDSDMDNVIKEATKLKKKYIILT